MRLKTLSGAAISGMLATALVLAGCTNGAPKTAATDDGAALADMDPIVLTYSDGGIETNAHAIAMRTFMETVTEQTDGKITFETYWSGSLHPVAEALSALETGLTDITYISVRSLPEELPAGAWEAEISQGIIPGQFPVSLTTGTPVQSALYQDSVIAEQLASHDVATLASWTSVPNPLLCRPEIESAADLEGKTSFTAGATHTAELTALGMTTITIPVTDVYEAMQRGMVDCIPIVVSSMMGLGLWDEAKYFVPAEFATSAGVGVFFNKSVLESLPIEVQRIIFDARPQLISDIVQETLARNVVWAQEAPGKEIVWVDPAEVNEEIEAARDAYVSAALANPPATISDPESIESRLDELVSSWEGATGDLNVVTGSPTSQQGWIDLYSSVDDIDWDAYLEAVRELLAEYRP